MKKVKIIPISIFYIIYFAFNYLNSLFLLGGVFNPNISEYTSFGSFILSSLGDLGVLCLLFFVDDISNIIIEMGTKRAPININKLTIDKFIPPTLLVYCNTYNVEHKDFKFIILISLCFLLL